jgi:hypothetical protein
MFRLSASEPQSAPLSLPPITRRLGEDMVESDDDATQPTLVEPGRFPTPPPLVPVSISDSDSDATLSVVARPEIFSNDVFEYGAWRFIDREVVVFDTPQEELVYDQWVRDQPGQQVPEVYRFRGFFLYNLDEFERYSFFRDALLGNSLLAASYVLAWESRPENNIAAEDQIATLAKADGVWVLLELLDRAMDDQPELYRMLHFVQSGRRQGGFWNWPVVRDLADDVPVYRRENLFAEFLEQAEFSTNLIPQIARTLQGTAAWKRAVGALDQHIDLAYRLMILACGRGILYEQGGEQVNGWAAAWEYDAAGESMDETRKALRSMPNLIACIKVILDGQREIWTGYKREDLVAFSLFGQLEQKIVVNIQDDSGSNVYWVITSLFDPTQGQPSSS